MEINPIYMQRALQLAANGAGSASPNPMVGAVIVAPDGRVIGEGWHRRCGEGHAEVNAVASVTAADRSLLTQSTMYVTLEPCSHYGKTPPCAELILRTGIPRVVVATGDPNPKVSGRGIAMLREAGVEVEVGLLGEEARALNRRFFLSQTLRRPWITLKWARSADGFMDHRRIPAHPVPCRFSTASQSSVELSEQRSRLINCRSFAAPLPPCRFSTPLTSALTMQLRSLHDGILTTAATVLADDCTLTLRNWPGNPPRPIILDPHSRLTLAEPIFAPSSSPSTSTPPSPTPSEVALASSSQSNVELSEQRSRLVHLPSSAPSSSCPACGAPSSPRRDPLVITALDFANLLPTFEELYRTHGISSVLVEAGPRLLSALISQNLWDAAREEVAIALTLGASGTHPAPSLPSSLLVEESRVGTSLLRWYRN